LRCGGEKVDFHWGVEVVSALQDGWYRGVKNRVGEKGESISSLDGRREWDVINEEKKGEGGKNIEGRGRIWAVIRGELKSKTSSEE